MRFVEVSPADMASELKAKWPRLVSKGESTATDDAAAAPPSDDDLIKRLQAEAVAERNADQANFLDRMRRENPFRAGPRFNLTDQMRLTRLNPALAGTLKSAAEAR
jgi:hypothetical protein